MFVWVSCRQAKKEKQGDGVTLGGRKMLEVFGGIGYAGNTPLKIAPLFGPADGNR